MRANERVTRGSFPVQQCVTPREKEMRQFVAAFNFTQGTGDFFYMNDSRVPISMTALRKVGCQPSVDLPVPNREAQPLITVSMDS